MPGGPQDAHNCPSIRCGSEKRPSQSACRYPTALRHLPAANYRGRVRSVTARAVLGGRWAASPAIWLVLFGPASLLVITQEILTEFRWWWALPVSALAQHVGGGLVILALVFVLRRFYTVIPVGLTVVVWVLGGVVRGLISGWFVEALSYSEPQYEGRVLFWAVATGVWLPLVVYTATQLDLRASLLSSVITLRMDIEVEHAEADISEQEREGRLMSAVATALAPVIIEIRQSLETALSESRRPLATISDKIESVVENVLDIIVHEPIGAAPRTRAPRRLLAPLSAALTFDSSRPIFASALIAVGAGALLIPESLRLGGAREALDIAVAIGVAGIAAAGLLILLDRVSRRESITMLHVALVLVLSIVASEVALLLTSDYPLYVIDVSRVVALPVALLTSAVVLSTAVGLTMANIDAIPEETRLTEELADLRALAAAREEATREQFTTLMHGPILGRLSACVMALNFHASGGGGTAASRAQVAAQVIAHLDLVAADLDDMTAPREYT